MIISKLLLPRLCEEFRGQGKRIAFTNGCFDILHAGHTTYLAEAKKMGDILIVGLNSDKSVRRLKGDSRPVNGEIDRAIVLDALKSVDIVTIFDEDTPLETITLIRPDIIVKGGDYDPFARQGSRAIVGADFVRNYGGEARVIPFVEGKSTTSIIERMTKSR